MDARDRDDGDDVADNGAEWVERLRSGRRLRDVLSTRTPVNAPARGNNANRTRPELVEGGTDLPSNPK
jgi:hypothetical protein